MMEDYSVKFWHKKDDGYWTQTTLNVTAKDHQSAADMIMKEYQIPQKKIVSVKQH